MIREFNGKYPKIARFAFVSEAAYIVGDVEIGADILIVIPSILKMRER